MSSRPTISIFNLCTVLSDDEIAPVIAAVQTQINQDFAPLWDRGAKLVQVPKGESPDSDHWWCGFFDNSDVANALGYHDLTTAGFPLAKVFAATDQHYGLQWSVTLSHEVLEMLGDPTINLSAQIAEDRLYAYENCDAVEADELGYQVDGVLVSDFVTPAWFMPGYPGPWDFKEHLNAPLEIAQGGYISVLELGSGAGWTQIQRQAGPGRSASIPRVGSRRERRRRSRELWLKSDPDNHADAHKRIFGQ